MGGADGIPERRIQTCLLGAATVMTCVLCFIPLSVNADPVVRLRPGEAQVNQEAPATSSEGGWTFQNTPTTAADILAPQQPPGTFKYDGIRSVVVNRPASKAGTTSGFGYYVRNDDVSDAAGFFGTTVCNKDGASCWGGNPTLIDALANGAVTAGVGRKLIGIELDVQVTSPHTIVSGYNCTGTSAAQPVGADCFQIGHLNAAMPGRFKWSHAVSIGDGTSIVGVLHGAINASGALTGGIPDFWNYRDASGALRAIVTQASGTGAFNVTRTDAANGVAVQPAGVGQAPSLQAFGSDPNVSLVLKGQGIGPVVTESPLNAKAGLAAPTKLAEYTVATLPRCDATARSSIAAVIDADSPAYNSPLTGGGSIPTSVYCRGDIWVAK
jgi:hypothetical protein